MLKQCLYLRYTWVFINQVKKKLSFSLFIWSAKPTYLYIQSTDYEICLINPFILYTTQNRIII